MFVRNNEIKDLRNYRNYYISYIYSSNNKNTLIGIEHSDDIMDISPTSTAYKKIKQNYKILKNSNINDDFRIFDIRENYNTYYDKGNPISNYNINTDYIHELTLNNFFSVDNIIIEFEKKIQLDFNIPFIVIQVMINWLNLEINYIVYKNKGNNEYENLKKRNIKLNLNNSNDLIRFGITKYDNNGIKIENDNNKINILDFVKMNKERVK